MQKTVTVRRYPDYFGSEAVVVHTVVGSLLRACELAHLHKQRSAEREGVRTSEYVVCVDSVAGSEVSE